MDDRRETPERIIPKCCQSCDYYKPRFWRVWGKECAAFGPVDGVKDDRCGLYSNGRAAAQETR